MISCTVRSSTLVFFHIKTQWKPIVGYRVHLSTQFCGILCFLSYQIGILLQFIRNLIN